MEGAPVADCGGAECEAMAVGVLQPRKMKERKFVLTLDCPAWRHAAAEWIWISWRFLWAEVRHAAVSLLREVHQLAAVCWVAGERYDSRHEQRAAIHLPRSMTAGA